MQTGLEPLEVAEMRDRVSSLEFKEDLVFSERIHSLTIFFSQ